MEKVRCLLRHPLTELIARTVLAAVFLYACVHKILHPADFAKIIYGYKILPGWAVNLAAITMPWFELAAGLSLLLGVYPRAGALLASGMLLIFILAISFNLIRGHEFDCGCFTVSKAGRVSDARELLVRDALYLLAGFQVLLFSGQRKLCLKRTA
jgi:uncharacterized membrane protein YphA (DoxX/SURF4 family)